MESYAVAFAQLLQTAIRFAGGICGHVLVISIPDWSITPFVAARGADQIDRFARDIEIFNSSARAEVVSQGAMWVDITGSSRSKAVGEGTVSWEAADGLHPSPAQVVCG